MKKTVQAGIVCKYFEKFLHSSGFFLSFFLFFIFLEGHEHRKSVETYNASQRKWVDDMVSACSICRFVVPEKATANHCFSYSVKCFLHNKFL